MLKQTLTQKLLQKLSPQQIQFIKLLQVPTASLDARIKEELEENPALEDISLTNMNEPAGDYPDNDPDDSDYNENESVSESDEFNVEDYLQSDDGHDYGGGGNYGDDDEDRKEIPIPVQQSFYESLQQQLGLLVLSDRDYIIGKQIIGSLDDDGYLRRPLESLLDDLAFSQNIEASIEEVEDMLQIIQSFEPAGIGARDLQECLLLQLRRKDQSNEQIQIAIHIIENYLEEFTKKHYDKLEKNLNLDGKQLKLAIQEILKLNPKPGDSVATGGKQLHIIPDFHITNNDGVLQLSLNARNAPELRVSRSYMDMFEHYEKAEQKDKKMKEAVQFVKQKLDSAKWFIDAIRQRNETMMQTMSAIVAYQHEFFLQGDSSYLKPMVLKDIADRIGHDVSTISRVCSNKYVQTQFGTFALKYFFSESITKQDGGEISTREIKDKVREVIANEDKTHPITDDELVEILHASGYAIARRTVAKYREQLGIPVARLRHQI